MALSVGSAPRDAKEIFVAAQRRIVIVGGGVDAAWLDPSAVEEQGPRAATAGHGPGRGFLAGDQAGDAEELVVGLAAESSDGLVEQGAVARIGAARAGLLTVDGARVGWPPVPTVTVPSGTTCRSQ